MDAATLKAFVSSLLTQLGIESPEVVVSGTHRTVAAVSIHADDSKRVIGPGGEHLRALNLIARRLAEKLHGEEAATFLIDVNGYQEAQLENVRANARMLAQRARLFKHDVEMGPMSPYERLVIHELFAEDPDIKTVSEGEGKFRHIVLKYGMSANAKTSSI